MKKRIAVIICLILLCACSAFGAKEAAAPGADTPALTAAPTEPAAAEEVVAIAATPEATLPPTPEPTPMPEPTPTPTPTPEPTPEPTPTPSGLLGGRFPDKFSDTPILEDRCYKSKSIGITIETYTETNRKKEVTTWHVADIYVQDVTLIRTAPANNDFTRRYTKEVEKIASNVGALLAIDGDTYSHLTDGIMIRNGVLYRKKLTKKTDICVLYRDGRMETKKYGTFNLEEILAEDPWQAWSFGPALLDEEGHAKTIKHRLSYENPRAAIGYYEPGHYCFVIVEGRLKGMTEGMTLDQLSQLMEDLGCKAAYNLDGGASAVMYWVDGLISTCSNRNRTVSDIIYILPESEETAAPESAEPAASETP